MQEENEIDASFASLNSSNYGSVVEPTRSLDKPSSKNSGCKGCMVCRKSERIKDFKELRPGDHIETPISPWRLIKHHAIVKEVIPREDPKCATLKVIDVPRAGKNDTLKIESHNLQGKDEIDCSKQTIRKVSYQHRRNTTAETLANAEHYILKGFKKTKKRYNICTRNCEHFAVAMVSITEKDLQGTEIQGNVDTDKHLERATSLQAARCFWVCFHIVFAIVQCILFTINLYLYAVYARKDDQYSHFSKSNRFMGWCYTGRNVRGFETFCDWLVFAFIAVLLFIGYIILLCVQKRKEEYMCKECITSARIMYITKVVFVVMFEISNIFIEKPLYKLFGITHASRDDVIIFSFIISVVELFLLFLIPHLVVKCCLIRKIRTCNVCQNFTCCKKYGCSPWEFKKDSYEYVMHYA